MSNTDTRQKNKKRKHDGSDRLWVVFSEDVFAFQTLGKGKTGENEWRINPAVPRELSRIFTQCDDIEQMPTITNYYKDKYGLSLFDTIKNPEILSRDEIKSMLNLSAYQSVMVICGHEYVVVDTTERNLWAKATYFRTYPRQVVTYGITKTDWASLISLNATKIGAYVTKGRRDDNGNLIINRYSLDNLDLANPRRISYRYGKVMMLVNPFNTHQYYDVLLPLVKNRVKAEMDIKPLEILTV